MSPEAVSCLNPSEINSAEGGNDIVDRAFPQALRDATHFTCQILGDIVENDVSVQDDISLVLPSHPRLNFEQQDEGVRKAIFRLEKSRGKNPSSTLPHTFLDIELIHSEAAPRNIELKSWVIIEQTQRYRIGENVEEDSTIIFTLPVRLPEESEQPIFDMDLVNISEDHKKEFRKQLSIDIEDSLLYMENDIKYSADKRKIRVQGKPI